MFIVVTGAAEKPLTEFMLYKLPVNLNSMRVKMGGILETINTKNCSSQVFSKL